MDLTRRHVLAASGATIGLAGCLGDDDDDTDNAADGSESDDTGTGDRSDDTGTGDQSDDTGGDDGTDTTNPTVQVSSHADLGDILVDAEDMTLYMFESDTQGEGASSCYDDCADAWPPLTVDDEPVAGDSIEAELTTIERDDGTLQVVANGWPLYYFASDEEPGDAAGQGASDVWWVLRPDGSPMTADEADSDTGPY